MHEYRRVDDYLVHRRLPSPGEDMDEMVVNEKLKVETWESLKRHAEPSTLLDSFPGRYPVDS